MAEEYEQLGNKPRMEKNKGGRPKKIRRKKWNKDVFEEFVAPELLDLKQRRITVALDKCNFLFKDQMPLHRWYTLINELSKYENVIVLHKTRKPNLLVEITSDTILMI